VVAQTLSGAAAALGGVGLLASTTNYTGTIQLAAVVVSVLVVVIAGLFTIRAKNAEWWQQSYEGVKAAYAEEKERADKAERELNSAQARVATLESMPNYDIVVGMLKHSLDGTKEIGERARDNEEKIIGLLGDQQQTLKALVALMEKRLPRPPDA
jgi:hypothetical protein